MVSDIKNYNRRIQTSTAISIEKKNNIFQILLFLLMAVLALFVSFLILSDDTKPAYYSWLFLLPLTFMLMSVICCRIYYEIPRNLGLTIIVVLLFTRTVLSPFFMYFGNYNATITIGVENNTEDAILLVVYETIVLFLVMYFRAFHIFRPLKQIDSPKNILRSGGMRNYTILLIIALILLFICIMITPQLIQNYRTIFNINDEFFTSYEDAYTIEKYGTTFVKKLSLVTGFYLMRALLIIVPAYIIVNLSKYHTPFRKAICFICCFIPLFFIGGAIARSLIYIICLLFLYNFKFYREKVFTRSIILLCFGAIAVVFWWVFRSDPADLAEQFSSRFSAYFSGVNVVSGVFNLPNELEYKLRYFLYDFTSTIPFGGTLFNISHEHIQAFFNNYNMSQGQIPSTIGMGYYYLGPIFAPSYSIVFALIVLSAGEKLKFQTNDNPMQYIRLLLIVFYVSMGIIMYNIEITMTNIFSIILPMYIMEKISFRKEKGKNAS